MIYLFPYIKQTGECKKKIIIIKTAREMVNEIEFSHFEVS